MNQTENRFYREKDDEDKLAEAVGEQQSKWMIFVAMAVSRGIDPDELIDSLENSARKEAPDA